MAPPKGGEGLRRAAQPDSVTYLSAMTKNRLMQLIVWVLLAAAVTGAQSPATLQHQSWSTEAGLPQTSVHQVLQTRDGYLWLATEGGVVRFDGLVFTVLSYETDPAFTSNDVTSLAEDRAGDLWIGTADGLIERSAGSMRRFAEADGLPGASVVSVAVEPDGAVRVETTAGVARFAGGRFQPVASGSAVAREIENGNRVWRWTEREVSVEAGGAKQVWHVGSDFPGVRVQSLYLDRMGIAWIGTNRGLVTVEAGGSPRMVAALAGNSILSTMQDAEGNFWIGTETSGLHALRPRKFRQEPALAEDEVSAAVQATDGSMWVGTREDGLRHLRGGVLDRQESLQALTSPVILALAPGLHGDVWAGTPDGLNHIEASGKVTRYTSSDGLPDDLVRSLWMAHDGTLWIGTPHGLAHRKSGHFEVLTEAQGLGSDLIGTIFQAKDSSLWVGTLAGLSLLRDGAVRNFARADGLGSNLITALTEDIAGRVWIATRDAGMFLVDGTRMRAIAGDGIPREMLGVVADKSGFLWLRVRHGVVRVAAAELAGCVDGKTCVAKTAQYGTEDGMPSDEMAAAGSPVMWQTASGEVWLATRKGLAIVNPLALPLNTVLPPVVLEHFRVDSKDVPVGAGLQTLASGAARYTFEFVGLSYTVPSKVVYRTRLQGFDRDWSAVSGRRNASYTNLPPGTYRFRVQAANNDGLWNEAGASVEFRVLPPLYRRWWFLLLVGLMVLACVVLLYRLRVQRMQVAFEAVLGERSRIAREIHDTLAQDFVGVTLQLDMVSQLLARNKLPEAATQVTATRAFVKAGLEETRQRIWNLRANSAPDSLPQRVTALAQQFASGNLAVKIRIGGAYRALPQTLEEEVLRIVREALANVQRHAAASTVRVELAYAQDKLVVTVQDDGIGFTTDAARPGHYGLQGMRERAAQLEAELDVTSSPGAGTTVRLTVLTAGRKGRQR